jgi:hypothetical protein
VEGPLTTANEPLEPLDPAVASLGLESHDALRRTYQRYRAVQAAHFLTLIPREGVRPLYRAAREWATGRGTAEVVDPMAILVEYCKIRLPLPPFDVWLADFRRNRTRHLDVLGSAPPPAEPTDPVMVDLRRIRSGPESWSAGLNLFRDGAVWRGFIEFHGETGATVVRTANIFREPSVAEIRSRFRSFENRTLQAFLRSVLP